MPKEKITKENLYVYYNSLISVSCISETGTNLFSNYLLRMENLEQTLLLKKCQVPLSEFTDLKESLFFIREISGYNCTKKYKEKNSKNQNNNHDFNLNKEKEENIQEKRVNYNQQFILQHMISKNYIYAENIPGNNNYNLKLTSDINSAVPFVLERIHETRSSQEFLTFKQSFYLSIYIEDKDKNFYINSSTYFKERPVKYDVDSVFTKNHSNSATNNDNMIVNNIDNIDFDDEKDNDSENNFAKFYESYSELCIEKKAKSKYLFVNQSWYIKNKEYLFSSQIINIIFINSNLYKDNYKNSQVSEKEEQFMLSAEYVENVNEEEVYDINPEPEDTNYERTMIHKKIDSNFYDINKGLISQIKKRKKKVKQTKVKVIPYEKEFYKHVMNNCFWVIEEEKYEYKEKLKKIPLKSNSQIKIKNILLGLYLKVKKKGSGNKNVNINNIDNDTNEGGEEPNKPENQIINIDCE